MYEQIFETIKTVLPYAIPIFIIIYAIATVIKYAFVTVDINPNVSNEKTKETDKHQEYIELKTKEYEELAKRYNLQGKIKCEYCDRYVEDDFYCENCGAELHPND